MQDAPENTLFYGDNLEILSRYIPTESVDLIYLDPPFNSARNYNLLFKQHAGKVSPAQIAAFEDTWQWSYKLMSDFKAERRNAVLFEVIDAFYQLLGDSEIMAYILMMAPRLVELHRVLKSNGMLFLHCDPAASHYLKIVLDRVFGSQRFVNEIIWQRTGAKGLASRRLPRNHDVILAYAKGDDYFWEAHEAYQPYDLDDLDPKTKAKYSLIDDEGRRYELKDLTNPNPDRPNLTYEFLGVHRTWRWTRERMQAAYEDGLVVQPRPGAVPRYKSYLDERKGRPLGDVWIDIPPINSQSQERRGYPTQKPLSLLERILKIASREGDFVLDPFCGCGTALVAAERLGRRWLGIDITYLAISEVIYRLRREGRSDRELRFNQVGIPTDADAAEELFRSTAHQNHKPFEQWAVSLVSGEYRDSGGADRGIDGVIPLWDIQGRYRKGVIQVKGGNNLSLSAVRDFARVIERENAVLGLLIAMKKPTSEMLLEASKMGYADWPSAKKYPRMQIRTVRELLENPRVPFEIPDVAYGGFDARTEGIGKAEGRAQQKLDF